MIEDFIAWNQKELESSRTLLAVSGGMDSVTMAHLFAQSPWKFAIAHCNFQLRGQESEQDATFVKALAASLGVPYFEQVFDTPTLAKSRKESIQVAARNLRYEWLESIRQQEAYHFIATAHHLNDSIETLIFNFSKGCGLRGLHGIPYLNGFILRPLLFMGRERLSFYARQKKLSYREDASNASDKYTRNKIRHHVVPILQSINPALEAAAKVTFQRINEAELLYEDALEMWRKRLLKEEKKTIRIDWSALVKHPSRQTLLYEFISPFGFNNSQIAQILQHQPGDSGPMFSTQTHRLLLNRAELIIVPLAQTETLPDTYQIEEHTSLLKLADGSQLAFQLTEPPIQFSKNPHETWLDYDQLRFPLQLRHWRPKDIYKPLGMKGKRQKVQDLFINAKLSRLEKESAWLLTDADDRICWVVALRTGEDFKVRPQTKKVLHIKYRAST